MALSYRGYGGSSGRPTEKGLIEDAKATYAFAVARYAAERLVLWGESLGSALAVALAADNRVGCVVLEAPFTSAVDIGQVEPGTGSSDGVASENGLWSEPARQSHLAGIPVRIILRKQVE